MSRTAFASAPLLPALALPAPLLDRGARTARVAGPLLAVAVALFAVSLGNGLLLPPAGGAAGLSATAAMLLAGALVVVAGLHHAVARARGDA